MLYLSMGEGEPYPQESMGCFLSSTNEEMKDAFLTVGGSFSPLH